MNHPKKIWDGWFQAWIFFHKCQLHKLWIPITMLSHHCGWARFDSAISAINTSWKGLLSNDWMYALFGHYDFFFLSPETRHYSYFYFFLGSDSREFWKTQNPYLLDALLRARQIFWLTQSQIWDDSLSQCHSASATAEEAFPGPAVACIQVFKLDDESILFRGHRQNK